MIGYMSLRKSFYLSASLVPLLVITAIYYYYVKQAYDKNSEFVPLSLLRENQKNSPKSPTNTPAQKSTATNNTSEEEITKAKRHSQRDLLDDDLYQAAPDLYTNYIQPPMTLYNGILNTGMRDYAPPEIKGTLPSLWLPVKRTEQDIENGGFIKKLLGMNEISQPFSTLRPDLAISGTNKKLAAIKTQFVGAGSSSSSTTYGAVGTSSPISEHQIEAPEQVVISNEEQSTSSQLSKAQKRKSMADKFGELAGSNFS
jgi:hypothetical protein